MRGPKGVRNITPEANHLASSTGNLEKVNYILTPSKSKVLLLIKPCLPCVI